MCASRYHAHQSAFANSPARCIEHLVGTHFKGLVRFVRIALRCEKEEACLVLDGLRTCPYQPLDPAQALEFANHARTIVLLLWEFGNYGVSDGPVMNSVP